jgi:hypothetical protein
MRRALAAVVVGIAAGAAGAAVQADEPPRRTAPPRATSTPTPAPVGVRVHAQRIVTRVDDPGGGPQWAVKRIDSVRLRDGRRVGNPQVCVQLGRLRDGVFGWVFGDGAFRPLGPDELPRQCMPAKWKKPMAQFVSTLAVTDPASPRITAGVVWGRLPGASRVMVSSTEGADGAVAAEDGVFLRVSAATARPLAGAKVRGAGVEVPLGPGPIPARVRKSYPHVIPGTERVEARTPSPAGGPGYGVLVADTREGVPCVAGATQVIDGRTGSADLELGVFTENVAYDSLCRPLSERLDRRRPCTWGSWFNGGGEAPVDGSFLRRARVQRRVQVGRTVFTAICSADVERVTLASPRDIRTLVPSPVGHAVLAVYDGIFIDGYIELTAHLRGGGTWSLRGP